MNIITRMHIAWADYWERRKLFKLYGTMGSVGRNIHICRNYSISSPAKMVIGDNTWIGEQFYARAEGGIRIGSGVIISRNVEIWSSNHNYNSPDLQAIPYDRRMNLECVTIENNVWIGSKAVLLPGITIGEGAVIGAGAVVAKDVPACAVAVGNPVTVVKYRDTETYERLKKSNQIYLDLEYDYDRSSLRKSEYRK